MHVIVCIKQVPDTTNVRINPKTNTLMREGVESIVNPFDEYALELGLTLKDRLGAKVSVVSMGPPQAQVILREALAKGADAAYLVTDRAFAGSDTLATSYTLAKAIAKIDPHPDLVLFGKQAIDGDTAQVGPGVSAYLGYPLVTYVQTLEQGTTENTLVAQTQMDDGTCTVEVPLPAVMTVVKEGVAPRFASLAGSIQARRTDIPFETAATIQAEKEAVEVSYQEDLAKQDMETLENEFAGIESPRTMVVNDEVKKRLTEKYDAAKLEIERLQKRLRELSDRKPTTQAQAQQNSAEIGELRGQIATLRALLKHYVEEINRLNEENQVLRTQNETLSVVNQRLTSRVEETSRENATLNERMTLAEKLNVTGVNIHALNAKGKNEKKIEKAKRLSVSFTIPQNNSTPVGEKVIFMRITTPEGQLLGGGGSFSFEGGSLAASARKTIEYGGQEIGGITIYYDVRQALNPGTYTVELFCDNYRLCSRSFNLN